MTRGFLEWIDDGLHDEFVRGGLKFIGLLLFLMLGLPLCALFGLATLGVPALVALPIFMALVLLGFLYSMYMLFEVNMG
jgi:hypothetical protein